jgi:hypothetical protein
MAAQVAILQRANSFRDKFERYPVRGKYFCTKWNVGVIFASTP